jgi:hypothetical protein
MKNPEHQLRAFALAVALACLGPAPANAQTLSPYSDFQAMTTEQLATLQVKLTYVGPQNAAIRSVAFTSPANSIDLSVFIPFRRPGINYANDSVPPQTFQATKEELESVIDNAGSLPAVTAGGVGAPQFLSFSLYNSQPTPKAFEAVLNPDDSADLFGKLRLSLAGNPQGLRTLAGMACTLGLLEPERPTDVTASTEIKVTGLRPDRHTGRFVGSVSVKNNSGSALPAPLSLVLDLPGSVRLARDDGTTCGTSPVGRQFVHLSAPPAGLAPGETVTMTLQLENPEKEAVSSTGFKVLAGPGAR